MSLGFVPSDTNSHFALSPSTVTVRLSMTKVRHAVAFSPVRHNAINRRTSGHGYLAGFPSENTRNYFDDVGCFSFSVRPPLVHLTL